MYKIQFCKPTIGDEEVKAVGKVLKSGWLAYGKVSEEFEKQFAKYVGAKYAVFTDGCTAAMEMALRALGIGAGDEVIVPSFTFTATASVVVAVGSTPVFADIQELDLTMSGSDTHKLINRRTRAIIPMDFAGKFSENYWFKKYGNFIPLIRDSAHRVGKFKYSNVQCHSFYATKNMTTGKGGMLVTNDKSIYDKAKIMVNDGLNRSVEERYTGLPYYSVEVAIGGKDNIDILAAIGIEQLKKLPKFEKRRGEIRNKYNEAFNLNRVGTHIYYLLVEERDKFVEYLKEKGIQTSIFYFPLHQQPAYKKYATSPLPVTEWASERCVALPIYPLLSDKDVDYVIGAVKDWKGEILNV